MMSKNSSSNDNNKHQQKRITDGSIFATRESLRLVRQQSEGRETQEEEMVQRMRVRGGGTGRTIQTTTMRVKEHKAKTRTNDSSNRRKMIPQREEQHSREQREARVVDYDDSRRRNERNEDASRGASSSQRTDAATFAGSALQIRDDYYVDAKWNTNDTRRAVGRGEGDVASDEEEFTFR